MSFSIIAAIGKNRELGKDGKLLWRLPGDMEFFRKTTTGHPILMGRKTFESLPGVLPGRKHYVITRRDTLEGFENQISSPDGNLVLVSDLKRFAEEHKDSDEEIFVIGGGMVYWELLKYSRILYLTEVDETDDTADTFFPEFDRTKYERKILGKGQDNGIDYAFVQYTKLK